jgi:hypothetical protein
MGDKHFHTLDCVGTDCHDPNITTPAPLDVEPLLAAIEARRQYLGWMTLSEALRVIREYAKPLAATPAPLDVVAVVAALPYGFAEGAYRQTVLDAIAALKEQG